MMLRLTLVLLLVNTALTSATANASLVFDFSFRNSTGNASGTVSGQIFGLRDNEIDQEAAGILIRRVPSGFPNTPTLPVSSSYWDNEVLNSFSVVGGEIISGDFVAGGPNFSFLCVRLDFPGGCTSGVVAGANLLDFSPSGAGTVIASDRLTLSGSGTIEDALRDDVAKSARAAKLFVDIVESNTKYVPFLAPAIKLCGIGAFIPVVAASCATVAVGVVAINAASAWELGQIINDPPDPNYNEIYTPLTVSAPAIMDDGISDPAFVALANTYLESKSEFYSRLNAWRVTLERMAAAIEDGATSAALLQYETLLRYQRDTSTSAETHAEITGQMANLLEEYVGPVEYAGEELQLFFEDFLNEERSAIADQLALTGVPIANIEATLDGLYNYDYAFVDSNPFDSLRGFGDSLDAFAEISRCNGPCETSSVPNPSSLLLLCVGLVGLGWKRRKQK